MDSSNHALRRKKKKRKRTVISNEEIDRLEKFFSKEPRPDRLAKMDLAKELGKPEIFVSIWFQNRRARERKMSQTEPKTKPENESSPALEMRSEVPLDLRKQEKKTKPASASQKDPLVVEVSYLASSRV